MLNENSFCIRRSTSREETISWRESIQPASCPPSPASKTASGTIAADSLSAASPREAGRRCALRTMSSPSTIFTYARRLRATYAPTSPSTSRISTSQSSCSRARPSSSPDAVRLRKPYAESIITLLMKHRPDRVRAKTDGNGRRSSPKLVRFKCPQSGSPPLRLVALAAALIAWPSVRSTLPFGLNISRNNLLIDEREQKRITVTKRGVDGLLVITREDETEERAEVVAGRILLAIRTPS